MKNKVVLIVLVMIQFNNLIAQKLNNPKLAAKYTLDCLKNQDFDGLCKLVPTIDDIEETVKASNLDEERKEKLIRKWKNRYIHQIEIKTKFFKIMHGVSDDERIIETWKDVEIIDVKYLKENDEQNGGIEFLDKIYIELKNNDTYYGLTLDDCIKCKRGWLTTDFPRFRKIEKK